MQQEDLITTERLTRGTVVAQRYEIDRLIGSGGMALVYLARDQQSHNSDVALKILHKQFAKDKTYVERFVREVQLLSRVHHDNVVQTFDIGTDHGLIYFTMEYVPSESLERLMEKRSLHHSQMAHLIIEVCKGLTEIHRVGIIHRDLKPGNVLVMANGGIKITDFGIAREEASRLTAENQKVGSLCYMPPEVWLGGKITPLIDIYSLGVVLYELTTGEVPFEADWPGEVMRQHLEKPVIPPQELNPKTPQWLSRLILRLLEKDAKDRPQSASEIIDYVNIHAVIAPLDRTFANLSTVAETEPRLPKTNKTYLFRLTGTQVLENSKLGLGSVKPRRRATMVIPLPRRAAVIIEIDPPSRDFIYLGLFFASLQIFDGILTSIGVSRFGLEVEGNPILQYLMGQYGLVRGLLIVKICAVFVVVLMTVLAKRMRWIKDLISVLSCIYLFAAIIPWLYLLLIKYR